MSAQCINHFWVRATIYAQVRLKDLEEHILILVVHGLEINIMSRRVCELDK